MMLMLYVAGGQFSVPLVPECSAVTSSDTFLSPSVTTALQSQHWAPVRAASRYLDRWGCRTKENACSVW